MAPTPAHMLALTLVLLAHLTFAMATEPAAALSANDLSFEIPEKVIVWASRALHISQTLALPLTLYFRPVTIFLALAWLTYRAVQVLYTPLDTLASQLGFDIPQTPLIDLAGIRADGALIHWTLPERQRQRSRFKIQVMLNGEVVDSVGVGETAVTLTGLQPGTFYVARVALVNEQEFGTRSRAVRFRTKPASSGDFWNVVPAHAGAETDHDGSTETLPRVKLHRGLKDITPAAIEAAPTMRRESSSGLGPKRSITGRRPSPAALGLDGHVDDETSEATETVQQLTAKLDALRRETEDVEKAAATEEEEESRLKEELTLERDALRAEAGEKEKASRNLKREVNTLERQNTAAQNERTKNERLLQQKKQERQKLKDDAVRWEREAGELQAEAARIRESKTTHRQDVEHEKQQWRTKIADEASATQQLENETKEKNAEIKKLERALRNSSPATEALHNGNGPSYEQQPSLVQQMQLEAEGERQWQLHKVNLQQQYAAAFQKLEAAKRFHGEQMRYLESVRAQRRRDEELAQQQMGSQPQPAPQQVFSSPVSATAQERGIRRGDSQRSRRAASGHSTSDSPRLASFPMAASSSSHGPFASGLTSVAGAGSGTWNGTPFFNIHNGMTVPPTGLDTSAAESLGVGDEDRERLTGGAPMSPGAGAELLPADLFSSEDKNPGPVLPLPGLGSLPGLGGLPGPSPMPARAQTAQTAAGAEERERDPGPASPTSPQEGGAGSRSPSLFASPQASQNNLHLGSPENNFNIDPDRRSIRSTRSNRAGTGGAGTPGAAGAVTGSRFSSMFGIKPRKPNAAPGSAAIGEGEDGVPLGKAQSRSMPRQDGGILPGLMGGVGDAAGRKRNSSISGVFGADLVGDDGASDFVAETPGAGSSSSALVGKRRAFGMGSIFSRDREREKDGLGGWPSSFTGGFERRPGSPRPGSTHSNELPRPSMDSSRWGVDTWPSGDATASGARSSPLSFTIAWNVPGGAPGGSRLYGSRHLSRRPSVQYGASGPPEDIVEDEDSDALDDGMVPNLAPIGTKPAPGSKKAMVQEDESSTPSASEKKLNPAAKDFKSFFGLKKEKGRASSPAAGGSAGPSSAANTPQPQRDMEFDQDSPPVSRKSRDARSMTTTESSLAESNEFAGNDLARTPSYSNSDAAGSGPSPLIGSFSGSVGKESFMQKITRKSSSGKFSLPTFKSSRSRLDPNSTSGVPAEAEEEELSASVGSLGTSRDGKGGAAAGRGGAGDGEREPRESREGNRGSGRSWSSVLKLGKGKKAGGETPSLSGLSLASGTEDWEEGGEEEER